MLGSPEERQAQRRFSEQQEAEDRRHAETLRVMRQSRTAAHVAAAAAVISATAALVTLLVVVLLSARSGCARSPDHRSPVSAEPAGAARGPITRFLTTTR
jgi:hypothetical protein